MRGPDDTTSGPVKLPPFGYEPQLEYAPHNPCSADADRPTRFLQISDDPRRSRADTFTPSVPVGQTSPGTDPFCLNREGWHTMHRVWHPNLVKFESLKVGSTIKYDLGIPLTA